MTLGFCCVATADAPGIGALDLERYSPIHLNTTEETGIIIGQTCVVMPEKSWEDSNETCRDNVCCGLVDNGFVLFGHGLCSI
jgi:hypothetical protein